MNEQANNTTHTHNTVPTTITSSYFNKNSMSIDDITSTKDINRRYFMYAL